MRMGLSCGAILRSVLAIAIIGVCLVVLSCNSATNIELAEQGVILFHSQLDAEQYHTIYVEASEEFHKGGSEAEFLTVAQAIHRKLGRIQSSALKASQTQWLAGTGTIVTLFYDTQFASGKGTEKFMWRVTDNHVILVGYYIKSDDLIAK